MSHQLYPPRDPEVHTLETLGLKDKPQQLLEILGECISIAVTDTLPVNSDKLDEAGNYIGSDPAKDAWNEKLEQLKSTWDEGIPQSVLHSTAGRTAKRIHSHLEAAVDELVKYLHQK